MPPTGRRELPACWYRQHIGSNSPKLEAQHPFTRNVLTMHFGRLEFPPPRGLQGPRSKIFAWGWGIECRRSHASRGIHADSDVDLHHALNGPLRPSRNLRYDLMNNLARDKTTRCYFLARGGTRFARNWRLASHSVGCIRNNPPVSIRRDEY